jgi:hypothetical membrane protein
VTTTQHPAFRTARLWSILASAVVLAATIVVVGALTPGYSQLSETVSRLGSRGQPHTVLARAGLVLYGLLVVIGAGALGARAPGKERMLAVLVGGFGVAGVVAGIAPKDPPDGPHTLTSQIHVTAAITGGAMLMVAMVLVARYAQLRSDRLAAAVAIAITTSGVIVFPFLWGTAIYGLVERVLLATGSGWLVVLAFREVAATETPR